MPCPAVVSLPSVSGSLPGVCGRLYYSPGSFAMAATGQPLPMGVFSSNQDEEPASGLQNRRLGPSPG